MTKNQLYKLCNMRVIDLKRKNKTGHSFTLNVIDTEDVDSIILDYLRSYSIDLEVLYSSNVSVQNFDLGKEKIVLWDLSFWDLYDKFLNFAFFMHYYKAGEKDDREMQDYCRIQMEGTLYQYLSLKFIKEQEFSYCMALLYNANRIDIQHMVRDDIYDEYVVFKRTHMVMAKLWAAFHECGHLKVYDEVIDTNEFKSKCFINIRRMMEHSDLLDIYSFDPGLIKGIKDKVNKMNFDVSDQLMDELFSDAISLEVLENVITSGKLFNHDISGEVFAQMFINMLELFNSFIIILYDLYLIWDNNLRLHKHVITKTTYDIINHNRDIEHVLRGIIFPIILMVQADRISPKSNVMNEYIKQRLSSGFRIRKEMLDLFNIAYNYTLRDAILLSIDRGFYNGNLKINNARDILVGWKSLEDFEGVKSIDLFLKERGTDERNGFHMFVRRYGIY